MGTVVVHVYSVAYFHKLQKERQAFTLKLERNSLAIFLRLMYFFLFPILRLTFRGDIRGDCSRKLTLKINSLFHYLLFWMCY